MNFTSAVKKPANCFIVILALGVPSTVFSVRSAAQISEVRVNISPLWRERDPASLNVVEGAVGKRAPKGKFTFLKEDRSGTSAKFDVKDADGTEWRVKMGEEARAEVAATRLVWAAGYLTDEDYFAAEIQVEGMPHLERGNDQVLPGGILRGVRLERRIPGQKKKAEWDWFDNPFIATREFSGLRIMMALINNWDLKQVNNAVYVEKNGEVRYVVADLGASFGRTGNPLTRSKSNWADYQETKFIEKIMPESVNFVLKSRPFILTAIDVPNYRTRTRMESIAKDIPRAHARWLGQLLSRLSEEQIADCFRAAGYPPEGVAGFTSAVRARIAELNQL